MNARRFDFRRADPQRSGVFAAESRAAVLGEKLGAAERRKGRFIKSNEVVELGGAKSDVVEHDQLLS
jgi:hypothetical protein